MARNVQGRESKQKQKREATLREESCRAEHGAALFAAHGALQSGLALRMVPRRERQASSELLPLAHWESQPSSAS